ncbi:DUF4340 domain-containing protein [Maricaulis maris]|uniref:Uncharacterized protein DUF4340 n=1 Tax=Maricaulis maris TaxID=74318 RepID=A0A495D436_9PROT|nr:DUF4340 domain-containing protein [Maricaulis maris]RKQ96675.1 uncharacterized protein DUF4340 [Maricaulis maris]
MSVRTDQRRRTQLVIAASAAVVVTGLAIAAAVMDARETWRPDVSGPVLPSWSSAVASAREIEIHGSERFSVEQVEGVWRMPSRDGYPVRPERLAELDAYLAALTYEGARTANPARLARIGLAEPGQENGGTQISVRGADGAMLAEILLGETRGERVYVRQPGRNRAYAARLGDGAVVRPDMLPADAWLDLDFLELGLNEIARADVQPEAGPAYRLERAAASARNFSLRQPGGWQMITAAAGNGPAAALGRVRFRDVRRADRLGGEFVAVHTAETFSGLRVRIDVKALGATRWALITASAITDDAETEAAAINARVEGWAYLLSDLTVDRLIRPLDRIADPRAETEDAP